MIDIRCDKCNKLLGKFRECRELEIKCPRCGELNRYTAIEHKIPSQPAEKKCAAATY